MPRTTLTLSSKNYSSWSLRGWLMAKLAGIDFDEIDRRAERRRRARRNPAAVAVDPRALPDLRGLKVWDTLAIGEFLNEIAPKAGLLPKDQAKRAHCRSICGEMHSGFVSLRQALPMNIKRRVSQLQDLVEGPGRHRAHHVIWRECLAAYGGPFLFGELSMADAMYAPVVSRFRTYGVKLDGPAKAYAERIWNLPAMREWRDAALAEKEEIEELEVEF